MSVDVFLDTNVLIYAATGTPADAEKRKVARHILRAEHFGISTQVLQEFLVAATRKAHIRMAPEDAFAWMAGLDGRPCVTIDKDLIRLSAQISIRYKITYWDAAVVAAAEALAAQTLYTEDLNHGQRYGSVRAVNPFLAHFIRRNFACDSEGGDEAVGLA